MHIFEQYLCHICPKYMAGRKLMRKHYRQKHPNVPDEHDKSMFYASVEERYICNICNTVVVEETRSKHRDAIHPERKNFANLFRETSFDESKIVKELAERTGQSDLDFVVDPTKPISLGEIELIEAKWLARSPRKPNLISQCQVCRTELDPNLFVQHFVRLHSDELEKFRVDRLLHPAQQVAARGH